MIPLSERATGCLLHPVLAALEDDRLPQPIDLEAFADVEIRASVRGVMVVGYWLI